MGMYTGLRVKVIVKDEYREMINAINNGANWSDFSEQYSFLANYAKQGRAEFIPCGVLCYMPKEWEIGKYPNTTATDGFETSIDMQSGLWTFQCSLKNYNDEIEQFFAEVLPNIINKSIHIEYRYEEMDESEMYEFENGKIIKFQGEK